MMEKMKEKVGMRFVLGFLLFILCVTASSCNDIDRFFRGKDGHTNKREKESKETGRFQIQRENKVALYALRSFKRGCRQGVKGGRRG